LSAIVIGRTVSLQLMADSLRLSGRLTSDFCIPPSYLCLRPLPLCAFVSLWY
jgi:hypothetical protein